MAQYKNGIASKNKIYETAKRLIYSRGYRHTSIADIAEACGVPKGLVTYYYKKEELLTAALEELNLSVFEAIRRQLGRRVENSLQWHLIMLQTVCREIHADARKLCVYNYIIEHGLVSKKINAMVNEQLIKEIDDFGLDISPARYKIYLAAQYGAYQQFRRDYPRTFGTDGHRELIYLAGTVALRMAGVGTDVLAANIAAADAMLDDMDVADIHFLAARLV